ncbi:hypothetical protein GQ54DRAFT_289536 [Martensiomyces pterosporus]|nr:hypothetical protein GQ54DRAFT_289536 [Martensiomyces pterosporus]
MLSFTSLLLLFAAYASLLGVAYGDPSRLGKRIVATAADIGNFRGGILVKNGVQTSCECAVMDNKAAFVAANCLDYKNGTTVDTSVTYEVYLDTGRGAAPEKYTVPADAIHLHPAYDPTTFANNVAVVEFDLAERNEWVSYIGMNRNEWTDVIYVRRLMSDTSAMRWKVPIIESHTQVDDACKAASSIYAANTVDFMCTNSSTPSMFDKDCSVPYSSIYCAVNHDKAISALYSHSVVYGDSLCGNSRQLHYYTLLSNYVSFANTVLGRDMNEFDIDKVNYKPNQDDKYKMNPPAPQSNAAGTKVFGGDIYAREGVIQTPAPFGSHSSATAESSTASGTTHAASTAASTPDASSQLATGSDAGLTKSQIIAIAVAVPVVTCLLILGAFMYYLWYKKRKCEEGWSPRAEQQNINAQNLINEIGGASASYADLPLYSATRDGSVMTTNSPTKTG